MKCQKIVNKFSQFPKVTSSTSFVQPTAQNPKTLQSEMTKKIIKSSERRSSNQLQFDWNQSLVIKRAGN